MGSRVVILGAGLAGASLARQLSLETDAEIVLLERRHSVPSDAELKVGESTVQLGGHYFGKTLGLEAHLIEDHLIKNNLRFYWPRPGDDSIYSSEQVLVRKMSDIPSWQIDRRVFEEHLIELAEADPRCRLVLGARKLDIELGTGGESHRVSWSTEDGTESIDCDWLVDASGRRRYLAKKLDIARPGNLRHSSVHWWCEGRIDLEDLGGLSVDEKARHRGRARVGHLPMYLSTNHLMFDGGWLWLIPLRGGITSFGLVYDPAVWPHDEVGTIDKAIAWSEKQFPILAELDLASKLHSGRILRDFAHDCLRTIDADGWAMTGVAGRFSDPFYSPGSDLIGLHNTVICSAIAAEGRDREAVCRAGERFLRAAFSSYLPSYEIGYRAHGDPALFAIKYTWELAIYFAMFVFPFVSGILRDPRGLTSVTTGMARLGPVNEAMQDLLVELAKQLDPAGNPDHQRVFDLWQVEGLRLAERTFSMAHVDLNQARAELGVQVDGLMELARRSFAVMAVLGGADASAATDAGFRDALDLASPPRSLEALIALWRQHKNGVEAPLDPMYLDLIATTHEVAV